MKTGRKLRLWLSTAIALFGVIVAAISTAAWFQIDKQEPQSTMITGSSNLSINSVTGYKIIPSVGVNGFRDYNSTSVEVMSGSNLAVDNAPRDGSDTDYDMPDEGSGYYLIKQNPAGTYTYKHKGVSYATRFVRFDDANDGNNTATKTVYIDRISLSSGDTLKIKNYKYDGSSNETITINNIFGGEGASYSAQDKIITLGSIGSNVDYRIWLDYTENDISLGFEKYNIVYGLTANVRAKAGPNIQNVASSSNIDTGTTYRQFGFQQTVGNYTADWFVRSSNNGFPGIKVVNDCVNGMGSSTVWYDYSKIRPTPSSSTFIQVTSWQNNGDNNPGGTECSGWSGSGTNNWEKTFSYDGNFIKVDGWSNDNLSLQRRSEIKIYYKLGTAAAYDSGNCRYSWNDEDVLTGNDALKNDAEDVTGYTFVGFYKDAACTTAVTSGYVHHDTIAYAKYEPNNTITYNASYIIRDKLNVEHVIKTTEWSSLVVNYGTDYVIDSTYNTNSTYTNDKYETNEGAYYVFKREKYNNAYCLYGDPECTSPTTGGTITEDTPYYAKFVADLDDYTTFYVDTRYSYNSDNTAYRWTTVYTCPGNDPTPFVEGVKVSTYLFRLTMPNDYDFKVRGHGSANPIDYCTYNGGTIHTPSDFESGKVIMHVYLETNASNNHKYAFCGVKDGTAVYGNAYVQKYNTSTSEWDNILDAHDNPITMMPGDRSTAYDFILESGVSIESGSEIRIHISGGSNPNYNDDDYGDSAYTSKPYYVTSTGSVAGGFVMCHYVGRATFSLYITIGQRVEMHMIPDSGNGYYIMDYGRSSWNDASTAFKMIYDTDTAHYPSNTSEQYYAIINFEANNVWKARSVTWLSFTAIEFSSSVSGSNKMTVSNDNNKNITVNTAGKYKIYLKKSTSGSFSLYVDTTSDSYETSTPDAEFAGNSYYIVGNAQYHADPVTTTAGTVGFFGGTKMGSAGEISATYKGFYAQAGQECFIRSYYNGTDKLYTEYTNSLPSGVNIGNTADGVIHFDNSGFYNIYVYNGKITIETFQDSDRDDFFRLNELDTTAAKIDSTEDIYAQKTGLVLEIAFTCNNSYPSKMSMTIQNPVSYIGAFLYCSLTKLEDPYNTVHGKNSQAAVYNDTNLTYYSAETRLLDVNNATIPANSSDIHYAYIMIDYLPTDIGSVSYPSPLTPSSLANPLYFYINATQV